MQFRFSQMLKNFITSETFSGYFLFFCAVIAFAIANLGGFASYDTFWHQVYGWDLGPLSLKLTLIHWVNDGLMTIFFLMIGLEIRRELYEGELSNINHAILPVIAASGGALIPALIYSAFNAGKISIKGFGIPMATDIAFTLAVLSLLGTLVPTALKIFLTALAIIDDLIAILIIAFFYTNGVEITGLAIAGAAGLILYGLKKQKVKFLPLYIALGLVLWYGFFNSGVHASISGVLFAFLLPGETTFSSSIANQVEKSLHKPVAFLVLPIFAFANTGIFLDSVQIENLWSSNVKGIVLGLIIGKPLGIFGFSLLALRLKLARLSSELNLRHLWGGAMLGGIGFAMSIFITTLAFGETQEANVSKLAVVIASMTAGIGGYTFLRLTPKVEDRLKWRN